MTLEREKYGTTKDGQQIDMFTVDNGWMRIKMMTYGATLISVEMPDKYGETGEVTLGFDEFSLWEQPNPYFGATIGRFGNRIAGSSFEIDGTQYKLAANDGKNHLHGGLKGFDKQVWEPFPFKLDTEAGVKFCYTSTDGEEGYPGNLDIAVTISLTSDNRLVFEYKAVTDKTTPVNLTNHTYWNLRDKGTVYDHVLNLQSDGYLGVSDDLIPTGEILPVKGTAFDFTSPQRIGDVIEAAGGFDHCYVLEKTEEETNTCAILKEPSSGRVMTVATNQPGVQFYTGNSLSTALPGRRTYGTHAGLCLETQNYPDSVHQASFPSPFLHPGEEYHHLTIHQFSVET